MAKSRHSRQIALTQRKLAAVQAADDLLTSWWTRTEGIPLDDSGAIAGDASLAWRTRPVANPQVEALGGRVVRIEVVDRADGGQVLVSIECVLPAEAPQGEGPAEDAPGSARPGRLPLSNFCWPGRCRWF